MLTPRIFLDCIIVCLALCSCERAPVISKYSHIINTSRYQVGQTWTFIWPTNSFSTSKVKVMRVDYDPEDGPIIFVHVTGVMTHTWDDNLYCLSEDALNRSVVSIFETNSIVTENELKQFSNYYNMYLQGVKNHQFSKLSDTTLSEFLEHDINN